MHRLGRGTSGLLLFARTEAARRALAAEWRAGRVLKEYRALVSGVPRRSRFAVDVPIGLVPHPRLGRVHAAVAAGKPALSQVELLATRGGQALVSVRIPTGRPHQIRIHLAAAGHPLVGDPLYVKGGVPGPEPGLPGDGGYRLHAHRLVLAHPLSGAPHRPRVAQCPSSRSHRVRYDARSARLGGSCWPRPASCESVRGLAPRRAQGDRKARSRTRSHQQQ